MWAKNTPLRPLKQPAGKGDLLLLKFEEISDRTIASTLTNKRVYVSTEQLPVLADGGYYLHDLIGLEVYEQEDAIWEL